MSSISYSTPLYLASSNEEIYESEIIEDLEEELLKADELYIDVITKHLNLEKELNAIKDALELSQHLLGKEIEEKDNFRTLYCKQSIKIKALRKIAARHSKENKKLRNQLNKISEELKVIKAIRKVENEYYRERRK